MEKTEVQRRFTTTIPKKIRERLGLKEGMELTWDVEDGRIIVYPRSYSPLKGLLKGKVKYSREVKEQVEERFLELEK